MPRQKDSSQETKTLNDLTWILAKINTFTGLYNLFTSEASIWSKNKSSLPSKKFFRVAFTYNKIKFWNKCSSQKDLKQIPIYQIWVISIWLGFGGRWLYLVKAAEVNATSGAVDFSAESCARLLKLLPLIGGADPVHELLYFLVGRHFL